MEREMLIEKLIEIYELQDGKDICLISVIYSNSYSA